MSIFRNRYLRNQLEYTAPEVLFTLPNPNPYPTCVLIRISGAVCSKWSKLSSLFETLQFLIRDLSQSSLLQIAGIQLTLHHYQKIWYPDQWGLAACSLLVRSLDPRPHTRGEGLVTHLADSSDLWGLSICLLVTSIEWQRNSVIFLQVTVHV